MLYATIIITTALVGDNTEHINAINQLIVILLGVNLKIATIAIV